MKSKLFGKPRFSRDAHWVDEKGYRYSLWRWMPGMASEFIHHLPTLLAKHGQRPVVLLSRVSTESQRKDGNLDDATASALRELKAFGCTVLKTFPEVANGGIFDSDRIVLERAIEYARQRGAWLVVQSRDRFLRGRTFDGTSQSELPTVGEYMALRRMAGGVPLATILPPDDPGARSSQIKRGQAAKGTHVGRPPKEMSGRGVFKRRKAACSPEAQRLHAEGRSYRQIAQDLNQRQDSWPVVSAKTVWNWINPR